MSARAGEAATASPAGPRATGQPPQAARTLLIAGVALAAAVAGLRYRRPLRRLARVSGLRLRSRAHPPDPQAADDVIADRVRSALGRHTHRLGIPHPNVYVANHVAYLHGEVDSVEQIRQVEDVVLHVSGVDTVRSHLIIRNEHTRPHAQAAVSRQLRALRHGLRDADVPAEAEMALLAAALSYFMALLPPPTRDHVVSHLPADVRIYVHPTSVSPPTGAQRHDIDQMVELIARRAGTAHYTAYFGLAAVMRVLHEVVPEETRDITSVLPEAIRSMWRWSAPEERELPGAARGHGVRQ